MKLMRLAIICQTHLLVVVGLSFGKFSYKVVNDPYITRFFSPSTTQDSPTTILSIKLRRRVRSIVSYFSSSVSFSCFSYCQSLSFQVQQLLFTVLYAPVSSCCKNPPMILYSVVSQEGSFFNVRFLTDLFMTSAGFLYTGFNTFLRAAYRALRFRP